MGETDNLEACHKAIVETLDLHGLSIVETIGLLEMIKTHIIQSLDNVENGKQN